MTWQVKSIKTNFNIFTEQKCWSWLIWTLLIISLLFYKNIQRTILIIIKIQLGAQGHIKKGNLCFWPLYVQVCVHRFTPGWWSDPGPLPVTLWMIAMTETCLIPALMLGFWWLPHFDAVTRLNAPLCNTHIHSWPNSTIRLCIWTGGPISFFSVWSRALIVVIFLTFSFTQ